MRDDPDRLATLKRLLILDSPSEAVYDELVERLAKSLDVPIAMINMLDADRDWFKARVGLQHPESPSATSFCEVFFKASEDLIVVADTLEDARFCNHPLVLGPPFVRFYAGARLAIGGDTVGTLCAYDLRPRTVAAERVDEMRALAQSVVEVLKSRTGRR